MRARLARLARLARATCTHAPASSSIVRWFQALCRSGAQSGGTGERPKRTETPQTKEKKKAKTKVGGAVCYALEVHAALCVKPDLSAGSKFTDLSDPPADDATDIFFALSKAAHYCHRIGPLCGPSLHISVLYAMTAAPADADSVANAFLAAPRKLGLFSWAHPLPPCLGIRF